ncbi:MAG: hypothetical protein IJU57_01260 [Clostridia bacterium]|nr:hypothetical protein [Clostridia bacterium]
MLNQPEDPRTDKMDPADINIEDDTPAFNEEPDFSALLENHIMDETVGRSSESSDGLLAEAGLLPEIEEPLKESPSVSALPETSKYSGFVKEYVLDEGDIQNAEPVADAPRPTEPEQAGDGADSPENDIPREEFDTEFFDESEDGQPGEGYPAEYPAEYPENDPDGYYEDDDASEHPEAHIDDLELPFDYLEVFAEDDKKSKKPGLFSRIKSSFKSRKKRGNENQLEMEFPEEDQNSEVYNDGASGYGPAEEPDDRGYEEAGYTEDEYSGEYEETGYPEDGYTDEYEEPAADALNYETEEYAPESYEGEPAGEEQADEQASYEDGTSYTDSEISSDTPADLFEGLPEDIHAEQDQLEPAEPDGEFDDTGAGDESHNEGAEDGEPEEAPETEPDDGYEAPEEPEQFDPADKDLMVAFGLDGDGEKKSRAESRAERKESRKAGRTKEFKLDRPEFIDKSQIKELREKYKRKATGLLIRLCLCVIIAIGLLIYENIPAISGLFGGAQQQLSGAVNPVLYPVVYAMISLQLMLLCCLCAYEEILKGFKSLFKGTPRPESVTAVLAVLGIVYSIVEPSVIKTGEAPAMFNFVVALAVILTLVYSTYNNKREMMNFRIVASKKPKHIVKKLADDETLGELNAFDESADSGDVMKIEKTDFIDGFYARLDKPDASTGSFITFVMSISVALAVIVGIFSAFKGDTAAQVCRNIFISVLAFTPISLFISFSYPFFRANRSAKKYNSTIIGETSLEEYSNASIISFDDKNVFPSYSVKVQNIRIYNNARIDRVLYYAASVFAYAGGPLQDVFELATKDMGNSQDVQIFEADRGYLATRVDGVNIIFGNDETLLDRGFDIPSSATEDDVDFSDELSVMYMFRESKLVAKMYIKYVMDPDIDMILKQLSGDGLRVCVRTFDPNIDEDMIWKKLNNKQMRLQIIRYADADEVENFEEKADSGLVTNGSPKFLLQVISFCGRVLQARKTNVALCTLSIMIAIAIMILMLLTGALNGMNSLLIALYHLIWLIPIYISASVHVK